MAGDANQAVLGAFRTLFGAGTAAGLGDGELLERFLAGPGPSAELAFAALVERHGPMVRAACRGAGLKAHDVDDAFQATFLVLARGARSIRRREAVGPWLYGVARRVGRRARAQADRRARRERPILADLAAGDDRPGDADPLLEEIDRLSEADRRVVVLCCLEGRTYEAAAGQLGLSEPALRGRLMRARRRLRDRLVRRGVAVPAALLAGAATFGAPLPADLIRETARAAVGAMADGRGVALAKGVGRAMLRERLGRAAGGLLAVGLLSAGAVVLAQRPGSREGAGDLPATVADPRPGPGVAEEVPPSGPWGTLRGRVIYEGDPPQPRVLISQDQQGTKDEAVVFGSRRRLLSERLVVDPETQGVRDVLVYFPSPTAVDEGAREAAMAAGVRFQIDAGRFRPHVLGVLRGTRLQIETERRIGYALNARIGRKNLLIPLPPAQAPLDLIVEAEEVPALVPVLCDIHPWMKAYWFVADNPYFAVTDADGWFEIRRVPAGRQKVVVWQEAAGYLTERDGDDVVIAAGSVTLRDFGITPDQVAGESGPGMLPPLYSSPKAELIVTPPDRGQPIRLEEFDPPLLRPNGP